MEEDTNIFNSTSVIEVNARNRVNPKCFNSKGQCYLGCVKCSMYFWFNKEDIDNPICIYCKD